MDESFFLCKTYMSVYADCGGFFVKCNFTSSWAWPSNVEDKPIKYFGKNMK
jgi:hypothetical protein